MALPGGRAALPSGRYPPSMVASGVRPLIVGSGIAGLYVALRCQESGGHPIIVTKSRLEESNTRYAQGGIAAALGSDDSVELHLRDTLRAGAGLVDPAAAQLLTSEAPRRIADLVRLGVPFDTVEGRVALGREGAHSRARILHAGGDATGLQIEETLRRRVLEAGIEARERTVLRAVRVDPNGSLTAMLSREDGTAAEEWSAGPIVLATGGAGSLYRHSSNPSIATGEGVAIAFRAGARLADMEFIQFHPTAFYREGAPHHLISEALRGEGAVLRNAEGDRFLPRHHPDAELAPRDVVSRAIVSELRRTGAACVFLDATAIPRERLFARFPTICRFLATYSIDPSTNVIPVTPVAHYMIGGVATDSEGRTSLRNLLACGEVAVTGVHGANRLASNSLLEGLVFGERVARQVASPTAGGPAPTPRVLELSLEGGNGGPSGPAAVDRVRDVLWDSVGIVRDGPGLEGAIAELAALSEVVEPSDGDGLPSALANAVLVARFIAVSALARQESRGAHFRSDHPKTRSEWRIHQSLVRAARSAVQGRRVKGRSSSGGHGPRALG